MSDSQRFSENSSSDLDDEGVSPPRSPDGGISMDVDSSEAGDRSIDALLEHGNIRAKVAKAALALVAPALAAQATDQDKGFASPDDSWEVEAHLLLQDIVDEEKADSESDCESEYSAQEPEVGVLHNLGRALSCVGLISRQTLNCLFTFPGGQA